MVVQIDRLSARGGQMADVLQQVGASSLCTVIPGFNSCKDVVLSVLEIIGRNDQNVVGEQVSPPIRDLLSFRMDCFLKYAIEIGL
ncbi:hypothetical protein PM082_014469 [Marasmius tenuissimus]|nr:hypothetical protein PM082_014469 [Marasmius tenuissimus]